MIAPVAMAVPHAVTYKISSGTGFVVNREGHIVTSAHVVKQCQAVSIVTRLGEVPTEIVARDSEHDLAVLHGDFEIADIAPLRRNKNNLRVGAPVVMMGYPGEHGANGRSVFKKTRVTALRGPAGEEKWIQLANVAAQGNSGGPAIDASGNVVAVVSGMALTYRADALGNPIGEVLDQTDVAVTKDALTQFLDEHQIAFTEADSGDMTYGDQALRAHAHRYIVPVRCIQS